MYKKGIDIKIPIQVNKNDFTIIYKGKNKTIEEIQTTKEALFQSLRYFKERSQELQQQDEIYIHDNFPNQIFKNFIKCAEQKEIHIDDDNYNDYYELSKKYQFHELENEILNYIKQRPDLKRILDELSNENEEEGENSIQFDSEKVEIIAKNLDFCIQSGAMKKLPVKTLLRILNSPNRVLKNHHLLFEFVKNCFKNIKSEEIENFQPLLASLDLCEMSVDEIGEFVYNDDFVRSIFSPRRLNEGMKILVDDIRNKNEIFSKFEKEISSMKQKIGENEQTMKKQKEKIDKMDQKINQQESAISKYKSEIESNQKQIKNLNEISSKFEKEISSMKQKIDENEQTMKKQTEKIDKMDQKINQQESVISKYKSEIESNQRQMKNLFDEIRNKNEMFSKFEKDISLMKQKIGENETNKKQLKFLEEKQNQHQKKSEEYQMKIDNLDQKLEEIKEDDSRQIKNKILIHKDYDNHAFTGIISKLTELNHGNVNDLGIISISGNRNPNKIVSGTFSSLVDYNYNDYSYFSTDDQGSFICFDFKSFRISVSAYSIKSAKNGNPEFLKSWVIEGSNDKVKWIKLDSHSNENALCSKSAICTFSIKDKSKTQLQFQFIQLRIAGPSSRNKYTLDLTNIEFFGDLVQQ